MTNPLYNHFSLVNVAWLCLFCFIAACASDAAVPLPTHSFAPKVLPSKWYSEVYTVTALCDDQTFIQAQMIVTNIGLGDSNAACEMLILRPGEEPSKTCARFNKSRWNFSARPHPALTMGTCRLAQEGESTSCRMSIEKVFAAFSIDRPPASARSPDTIMAGDASKKFYSYEVLVPWTRLTAALRRPGVPEKQLQGFAMVEHSRSVGFPKDFSRGWICYYGCRADSRLLANIHFPASACKASGAVGWAWNNPDETPKPLAGVQMVMKVNDNCGHEIALPFVNAPDGLFAISGEQSLFRFSLIDELGPALGTIVRLIVGNPVTRYYRAQAKISAGKQPVEGILEIMNFE